MSGQEQDLDRNDPASDFKLEKARQRGSIAKGQESVFTVILVVAVGLLYAQGMPTFERLGLLVGQGIAVSVGTPSEAVVIKRLALTLMEAALLLAAPLLALIWIAAAGFAAMQAKGVFTAVPLKPDFNRLNPTANLKRIFSLRVLYDLGRIGLKIVLLGFTAYIWGHAHLSEFIALTGLPPGALMRNLVRLLGGLLLSLTSVYLVVAALDWMYSRWEFQRQMRMSKREMKDEHKEREGDPRIRARRRELRAEWAKRSKSVKKVGSADVLVTNPTHVAVALSYRHGEMPAPQVLTKGAGDLARRMRLEAQRCCVPIVQNPPLARALFFEVDQDQYVPEHHFAQVARILRWVYAARRGGTGASQ